MHDPTYDKSQIDVNPTWRLAWLISEVENGNAPLGWGHYIYLAERIEAHLAVERDWPFVWSVARHLLPPAYSQCCDDPHRDVVPNQGYVAVSYCHNCDAGGSRYAYGDGDSEAVSCPGCAAGEAPVMLDEDGVLTSVSGKKGKPGHAHDDWWYHCADYAPDSEAVEALRARADAARQRQEYAEQERDEAEARLRDAMEALGKIARRELDDGELDDGEEYGYGEEIMLADAVRIASDALVERTGGGA